MVVQRFHTPCMGIRFPLPLPNFKRSTTMVIYSTSGLKQVKQTLYNLNRRYAQRVDRPAIKMETDEEIREAAKRERLVYKERWIV